MGSVGGLRSKHSESTALSLLPLYLLPRHFSSSWCIHIIVRTYIHTLHTLDDPTGVVHSWRVTCVFFLSSFIRSVISPDPFTGTERSQCLLEISMIFILILNRNSPFSILVNESGLIATDQSEAFYMSWILQFTDGEHLVDHTSPFSQNIPSKDRLCVVTSVRLKCRVEFYIRLCWLLHRLAFNKLFFSLFFFFFFF